MATSRAYNGEKTVELTGGTLSGIISSDDVTAAMPATGTIESAQAGIGKAITIPAISLNGAKAGNYMLTQPSNVTVDVTKAAVVSAENRTSIRYADTAAKTSVLNGLPASMGANITYTLGEIIDEGTILRERTAVDSASGAVSYRLRDELKDTDAGKMATISVGVSGSTNYEDFTVDLIITLTDKEVPAVTANTISVTYSGSAVADSAITGTAKIGETNIPGTWVFKRDQVLTNVSDSGVKIVVFMPEDELTYEVVETGATVTINKATPTGIPKATNITTSGKTLADAALTLTRGIINVPGTVTWRLPADTTVEANTAYTWVFTPTDTDNYSVHTGSVTLYSVSYSRDSAGGSTTTETKKNPDGSKTTTVTDKNTGTVTETTTRHNGDKVVIETKRMAR